MRITALLAVAALSSPLAAQYTIIPRAGGAPFPPMAPMLRAFGMDSPRAAIGVTTSSSASSRDTLGVLVTSVRAGSPADKAGIEEGNRISSVNGVSLKLAAADVGEMDVAGMMTRRLTRELNKLKPGDEVELKVWASGQTKTMKLKTVDPEDLYDLLPSRRSESERATLGINIGTTGSSRDTLGVFVMAVEDAGPAAKAGIEEGSRIASINGVDLRGRRGDEEDGFFRATNANRLQREMAKVKPGDDVKLRVYYNGQYRDVTVKAARAADLPRRNRSITIMGGDIGDEIRRTLDEVRVSIPRINIGGRAW